MAIAVLGDVCLDLYYFITQDYAEYSVETGLKTRTVQNFSHELGGAGNVAVNCRRLGARKVDVYGIIGDDPYGEMVRRIFAAEAVGTKGLLVQNDQWATHVYHKVYHDGVELPRYDIGNFNLPQDRIIDELMEELSSHISQYQVVIINEQVLHGMHGSRLLKRLNALIEQYADSIIWLTDCRKMNDLYRNTIRKLNLYEARELYQSMTAGTAWQLQPSSPQELTPQSSRESFSEASVPSPDKLIQWLHDRWKRPVVLTLGKEGVLVHDGRKLTAIPGLHIIQQIDTVGAGDAFIAGLAVGCGNGAALPQACELGNFSAGVSIQQLYQTGHPSINAVNALIKDPDYRYNPSIADDIRYAQYLHGTDIEIISPERKGVYPNRFPESVIFDHDGTISTLRYGWESVMREMMIESIAGKDFSTLPVEKLAQIAVQVDELIEKTTGVQTLIQMYELVKLIRHHPFVPAEDILKPAEYKEIYNRRLLDHIAVKVERIQSGHLSVADVTLKGVVAFLHKLHNSGTRLYMASGTDEADVIKEAELLGYAELFNGGIFGSTGNISTDPKREVIRRILETVDHDGTLRPDQCIMFGDGPVEIREAKKHGIPAVGLVSDELQRYGINKKKRSRLVLAGADILIPDFSWIPELGSWIGWSR
ncbi:MAG: HAD hydrolase-like protein [Spirochaetia bacterium]|nr:HAD hydrolase-like protein [Spirochaetia bacterium]